MFKIVLSPVLFCIVLSPSVRGQGDGARRQFRGQVVSQGADSLILRLKTINRTVIDRGGLVSHRAMNIFLSEKAGYYLSTPDDLTLYKNSVVADAAEGTLAIYHNLYQAKGADDRVRSFLSIGARANIADAFIARHEDRPYNNQFGFLIKQTWIGKGAVSAPPGQKQIMDALRASILHTLEMEIDTRVATLQKVLSQLDPIADVPGQDPQSAAAAALQKGNADLRQEYEYKWALLQSEALSKGFNYRLITSNWTSISLYIPLITENFSTAPDLVTLPDARHAYPLQANISHTRLWESSKWGRLFFTVAGDLRWNNSKDADALQKIEPAHEYIGDYQQFITPSLKGRLVYFPTDSHIGVSFRVEQHFGDDHVLNGVLGVPIVLIDKQAIPAVDLEFQVRFSDMGHILPSGNGQPGRTSIGLSLGIPFSKIAY